MRLDCAALLLDLDGTLVDSTAAVERTWRQWAAEHVVVAERVLAVCHGRRAVDTVREFVAPYEVTAAVRRLEELELADLDGVVALPGAAALLAAVDGALPWAVVTSGVEALARARMAAAGLSAPEVLVTADSVRVGKPDPAGYRLAAEALGVPVTDCVVVEDTPAGTAAGRAAGARVVAVLTTFPAEALTDADAVATALTDLRVEAGSLLVTTT